MSHKEYKTVNSIRTLIKEGEELLKARTGLYETFYGNVCEYNYQENTAFDIDSHRFIPIEAVNFSIFLGEMD